VISLLSFSTIFIFRYKQRIIYEIQLIDFQTWHYQNLEILKFEAVDYFYEAFSTPGFHPLPLLCYETPAGTEQTIEHLSINYTLVVRAVGLLIPAKTKPLPG
jgi:hypothetical protein